MFLIQNLTDDLPLPRYMSGGAAGMDLYANVTGEVVIPPFEIRMIPTGVKISIPPEFEAQVRPRSGLAAKHGVTLVNAVGTVDSDYRGEISVPLINLSREPYSVSRGDRIAQMIISRVERIEWTTCPEIGESERGERGFGSTGNKG